MVRDDILVPLSLSIQGLRNNCKNCFDIRGDTTYFEQ